MAAEIGDVFVCGRSQEGFLGLGEQRAALEPQKIPELSEIQNIV